MELLNGNTLRQILADLEEQLPSDWSLVYNKERHFEYLQYVHATSYVEGSSIHICICSEIPIAETSSRYNLYEAISMPVVHSSFPEKVYFSYQFESRYLAVGMNFRKGSTDTAYFAVREDYKFHCQGNDPAVCPLTQAVKMSGSTTGTDTCLYSLFSDNATPLSCPVQVQYQDGPVFHNLGRGVWVYGAANGNLVVQCFNKGTYQGSIQRYELTGTGALRLQPGCEAKFGNVQLPSYVHGRGQFSADLPTVPVVDAFTLNLNLSLFADIISSMKQPPEYNKFLAHLLNSTRIRQHAIQLREFNDTIQKYDALRNQLPTYHPFRWISLPESQISGVVLLFLLNVVTTCLTCIWIRRLSQRGAIGVQAREPTPSETDQPLIRLRRRRRRQEISEETV